MWVFPESLPVGITNLSAFSAVFTSPRFFDKPSDVRLSLTSRASGLMSGILDRFVKIRGMASLSWQECFLHAKNMSTDSPLVISDNGMGSNFEEIRSSNRNRKYKDYVYRKMLVQEYLKKWRIFKRVKPKNDMMYHDIYNCICQNTKKYKIHNPLCQTYSPTVV